MTTPAGGIFWKARLFERFTLALEPAISWEFQAHAEAGAGLAFSPMIGMGAAPHVQAVTDLALTPAIGMAGGLNPFGMMLTPTVGMAQTAVNVNADLGLGFTPAIGVTGTEWYYPEAGLTFTPAFGMKPGDCKFDSVGAGSANGNSNSLTQSHTINGDAVVVFASSFGPNNAQVSSVTVGGEVAAPLRANYQYFAAAGDYANMAAYGLINPPTGSVSVVVHYNATAAVAMNSVSYYGAASFGTALVTKGTSSTPAHTVSSAGKRVAQAFSGYDTNFTGYSKNSRWNRTQGAYLPMVIGDCADHTSEVFTASNTDSYWASIAVPINPS